VPKFVHDRLEIIFNDTINNPGKYIDELIQLDETYPEFNTISNYLAAAYSYAGDREKSHNLIKKNFERFPNYLFARVQLAEIYLENREYDKFENLMENHLDLKQIYPERDVFHISEVEGILYLATRYYALQSDEEKSLFYFDALKDISPDCPYIFKLIPIIAEYRLNSFMGFLD